MTFDCGVTREMGEDPVAVCRYLGERDCINHVHFRNVVVRTPYVDYTEVFLDDGQVDLFGEVNDGLSVTNTYTSDGFESATVTLTLDLDVAAGNIEVDR